MTFRNPLAQLLCASLLLAFANCCFGKAAINERPSSVAGVLIGPCGSAAAQGPNGNDDDYSNASIDGNMPNTGEGLTTTPATAVFKNTVENAGSGNDAFMITAPTLAPGFTIEISDDLGAHYATLDRWTSSITLPVSYRASLTFLVRITVPSSLKALTAYDTVIRATSSIDPAVANETIDRIYAGFIRLQSTARVVNASGSDDIAKAIPGSELEFAIAYTNISSHEGTGNALLTATNLVINETGIAAPSNWATTTNHIVGASDTLGGYIVGDKEGSTSLTDIVMRIGAGQSGVFKFKRRVK
ncbi:MAG: hypothetical protein DMF72_03710 [Acidobacteria bacterium]|nr:MAG: hypothetical protein DMF72_03710 [Acidobacteriota bacterium]